MKKKKLLALITTLACAATCTHAFAACISEHVHSYVDTVVAPTCTEQGYTIHTCNCGENYTDTYVDANGHTEAVDEAVAPTCTDKGKTKGKHCSVCDTVLVEQTEVETIGHIYKNDSCIFCGEKLAVSDGLNFTLNADGKSYAVSGIGTCLDTDIVIPSIYNDLPVTAIGDYAFCEYDIDNYIELDHKITSIAIPDSITSIGEGAFAYCIKLTNIAIPNNVESIGYSAFAGCSGLTSITIPDRVTFIGMGAFNGCSSLTSITVDSKNTAYHSDGNCLIETNSKTLILGCKTSVIPSGGSVTTIGSFAFFACNGLTSITIPDGVTKIGGYAFEDCIELTSITISDSVTIIDGFAFRNCIGLTSIILPNSVTSIGGHVFRECSGLTSVSIPVGITSIDQSTFQDCSSLTSIIFKDTIAQWQAITKFYNWNNNTGNYTVICTDGKLDKNGNEITE